MTESRWRKWGSSALLAAAIMVLPALFVGVTVWVELDQAARGWR